MELNVKAIAKFGETFGIKILLKKLSMESINPKELQYVPKLKGDVGQFSKKIIAKAKPQRIKEPNVETIPIMAASGTGNANASKYVVREHGLSEIMIESEYKPSKLTQCIVDTPYIKRAPKEPYITVEGEYILVPDGSLGKAVSHRITESEDKLFKYVQFYDADGMKVDARIKVPRCSPMTKEETIKYFEDLKAGRRKVPTRVEPTPDPIMPSEPNFHGFRIPEGTEPKLYQLKNGNSFVQFVDKFGNIPRRITLDKNGKVLSYTDTYNFNDRHPQGTSQILSSTENGKTIIDETHSFYSSVVTSSHYVLNEHGGISKTIQSRTITPHRLGVIENPLSITVETRGMSDGNYWEDITMMRGEKKFKHSFIKHGNRYYKMSDYCDNLSKEEIEMIKSDPFLASRFYNNPVDVIKAERPNAYKMRKLQDKDTPIYFGPSESSEDGYYRRFHMPFRNGNDGMIHITQDKCNPESINNIGHKINILHHETNHGRQHDLIEALKNGTINPADREFAEKLKYAKNHYISPSTNFNEYMNNFMEVDSYKVGDETEKLFNDNELKILSVFF